MLLRHTPIAIASLTALALAGCGGGGGTSPTNTSDSTITGVAAYGAPLAGATITATDAAGHSTSATANSDGSYSIKVTGFSAPVLLRAHGTVGDAVRDYLSIATAVPATGASSNVNVTPLTHAIVAMVSSDGTNPNEFTDASKLSALDSSKIATALRNLRTALAPVITDLALGNNFNPLTASFKADRTSAADQLLDTVKVSLGDQGVTLLNTRALLDSSQPDGSTSVTIKGLPNTAPATLPAPTVTTTDIQGLDTWIAQVNACLALAPTSRVSTDGAGNPTAFLGACNTVTGFSISYLQSGYNLLQTWGKRLAYIPSGASLLAPEFLTFIKGDNTDTYALVRLAYTSPSGGGSYVETAHKTASGWVIEGNQRKYDAGTTIGLIKSIDASTNPNTIATINGYADSGKNVGRFSSYSSYIYFSFNQSGPNGANVYAVRVKGPGLPTAGLVFARSSACGTNDYLAFYRNDGVLPTVANLTPVVTGTGNGWGLDAVKLNSTDYTGTDFYNQWRGINNTTGAPSTSPSNNVAAVAVNMSAIPEYARYTWEVFTTASGGTAADTFASRIAVRPLAAAEGAKQAWAAFDAASQDYVNPASSHAGELTSATLAWTLPSNAPVVTSAYMNGYDGTNRSHMDGSVAYGATSVSLSMAQDKDGSGNVCSYNKMPTFTATTGSRAIYTRQYTDRRLQLQQSVYHSGRPS